MLTNSMFVLAHTNFLVCNQGRSAKTLKCEVLSFLQNHNNFRIDQMSQDPTCDSTSTILAAGTVPSYLPNWGKFLALTIDFHGMDALVTFIHAMKLQNSNQQKWEIYCLLALYFRGIYTNSGRDSIGCNNSKTRLHWNQG